MKRRDSERVFVGLGANLGEPLAALHAARKQLSVDPAVNVVAASSLYWTDPVGGPAGQPSYLNAVLELKTTLEPMALLTRCLDLEKEQGRVRDARWGPRTLDVDLLLYGDRVLTERDLTLPHPRLHQRAFVLVPLCELAPQVRHPLRGQTVKTLLQRLPGTDGVRRAEEGWDV